MPLEATVPAVAPTAAPVATTVDFFKAVQPSRNKLDPKIVSKRGEIPFVRLLNILVAPLSISP